MERVFGESRAPLVARLTLFLLFFLSVFRQSTLPLYMQRVKTLAEIVALTEEEAMVSAKTK